MKIKKQLQEIRFFLAEWYRTLDTWLLWSIAGLIVCGIFLTFSASPVVAERVLKTQDTFYFVKKQLFFLIPSIGLMLGVSMLSPKQIRRLAFIVFTASFIALILTLVVGMEVKGAKRWLYFPGFSIQPSEFMKLALIIFTSKYIYNNPKDMRSIKRGAFPILFVVMVAFFLIMLQPDFGTGTIIVMTIVAMLFISGVNFSFFIKIGMVGLVGVCLLIIAAPYRMERIVSFLNPWSDPLGTGFQAIQSLYAIGPGGLFGMGFGNSIQKHFYLPEPQTDFIFSIISEELGIIGIVSVATLFLIIILRSIKISIKAPDNFAKFLSFGIIFQLSFQTLLNLAVVVGLIPVTGVTLPFFSYGGSSLIITLVSMGIILNISRHKEN